MASHMKTQILTIGGMTCVNCQNRIEKKLRKTTGIGDAKVSYNEGTASVTYDADSITIGRITDIITELDYQVLGEESRKGRETVRMVGLLVIILALYVILEMLGILNMLSPRSLAHSGMSLGMLFVIGLMTSVHCIAMCGGINLSQSIQDLDADKQAESGMSRLVSSMRPAFLYNLGRVISYTAVGMVVGALGSAITFSSTAQGILKLIAGIFMLIMGINMLGIFPWLRKWNPRMPRIFARQVDKGQTKSNSPMIVGLLNGFMPCGPLQAMQIYALSTGSALAGALSMFIFSLGTVPLMFGFGAIVSMIGQKFAKKVMTVGAVMVAVLGLSMLTQGFSLAGVLPASTTTGNTGIQAEVQDEVQVINTTLQSNEYPDLTVTADVPVKWIVNADASNINGCNNRLFISEYNLEHTFTPGENIIEFTPTETGTYQYSCWMGMIRAQITVVSGTQADQSTSTSGNEAESQSPIQNNVKEISDTSQTNDGEAQSADENNEAEIQAAVDNNDVGVAEFVDGVQKVTVRLGDGGFSPSVLVIQRNEPFVIQVEPENTMTNEIVHFQEYGGSLSLGSSQVTPQLTAESDFSFETLSKGLRGFVKVVDSLENIDYGAAQQDAVNFTPTRRRCGCGCCR